MHMGVGAAAYFLYLCLCGTSPLAACSDGRVLHEVRQSRFQAIQRWPRICTKVVGQSVCNAKNGLLRLSLPCDIHVVRCAAGMALKQGLEAGAGSSAPISCSRTDSATRSAQNCIFKHEKPSGSAREWRLVDSRLVLLTQDSHEEVALRWLRTLALERLAPKKPCEDLLRACAQITSSAVPLRICRLGSHARACSAAGDMEAAILDTALARLVTAPHIDSSVCVVHNWHYCYFGGRCSKLVG